MKGSVAGVLLVCTLSIAQGQPEEQRLNPGRDTAQVNLLNRMARQYALSDPGKARPYMQRARELSDSLKYTKGKAEALFNESLLYRLKEQSARQLTLLLEALHLFEAEGDSANILATQAEIGFAYHQQGDHATALTHYRTLLELYRQRHDLAGEAFVLRRMGTLALQEKDLVTAEKLYNEVLLLETRINNKDGLGNIYNNLGVLYFEKGEYQKSLEYHRQALGYLKETNNISRLPASYHNQGLVYLALGQWKEAEQMALQGLPIAQQIDNRMAIVEAAELLYDINKTKKDYVNALHYLELRNTVRDSIISVESALQFARVKALAETEQKEIEITYLKKEQEYARFRQLALFGFIALILVAGTLVIFYMRQSLRARRLALLTAEEAHRAHNDLIKVELENKQLREDELRKDLEFRQKELVTYTLNLAQKNALMENLRDGIRELLNTTDKDQKVKLTKLIRLIDYSLETEKDWTEFKMHFEKVHHSFFDNLKKKFPDLSQSDLKLCALISLNLSSKDMAELMGISPESVKMARHRLRKKLDLATEENLADFVLSFKST